MATKKGAAPPDPEKVAEALSNSMLKEMINELEETKLKLLLNIKELKDKLVQQKDDQADIYYYLNKKCDESFEVIASLEEQIINEQTDREIAEKMYENRIEEMKASQQVMEGKYTSKISELETRLEMLNSFNEEKEESEKTLKQLMAKLEEERNQFRTNTESIENRFLLERDKLRKTYDQKYEKIKKELEASVEGKMSNKTKKTQIMNVVMKKELDSQVRSRRMCHFHAMLHVF
jgi:DNA repair exonuclease SbcCD ATPase subunit